LGAGQTLMPFFSYAAWLTLLPCLLLTPAQAARPWDGRVTHVTDGDTLWVQAFSGGEPQKLRLEGLDAPEVCQPWGLQAHVALQSLLLGQQVRVRTLNRDAYGRRLSQVWYQGQDVGDWLVRQGHAWSSRFQGRSGRYDAAQQQAQLLRKGLFSQAGPWLTPRQFRQRYGACRSPQTGHPG
jgi:micrococcal nuclease